MLSDLGTRISGIAFPLLVLALTGSPAKAGVVEFFATLPLFVLTLPAGAFADRWNRKRTMIVCDSVRCLAYATLVAAIAARQVWFTHLCVVALVDGIGYVFVSVSERSALRHVVPDEQLPDALARNQAREYASLLAGTPLGGVLYAAGRAVPFLVDAVSYFVSVISLLFIRAQLQGERTVAPQRLATEIREGVGWFWRQPFIRTTSLLVTGSDFTLNALFLVVIVIARERGASPALIGAMFAFLGVGGILGAAVAPRLSRALPMRVVVVATMWTVAALVPFIALVPGSVTPGLFYGAMFLLHPTWNAVVGAYRLRVTPHELLGRVASVTMLLSLGSVPFAGLLAGVFLSTIGSTATVFVFFGVMLVVATCAFASRAVRQVPGSPSQ